MMDMRTQISIQDKVQRWASLSIKLTPQRNFVELNIPSQKYIPFKNITAKAKKSGLCEVWYCLERNGGFCLRGLIIC